MRQVRILQFRLPAAAIVLVLLSLASAVARAEDANDKALKNWQKFKPGSSVTMSSTMSSNGMNIQVEMKKELLEVAADKVTLQITVSTVMNGQHYPGSSTKQVVDAKTTQGEVTEVGHEKIEAAGKTWDCTVVDGKATTPTRGGQVTGKGRIWINGDVPGGAVQIKAESQGHEMTFKMTAYEVK